MPPPQSHFLKIHFNIILPSTPGCSKRSLSLRFFFRIPACNSPLPHSRYVPGLSHSTLFDRPKCISWKYIISLRALSLSSLLRYHTVSLVEYFLTFRRMQVPSSSGSSSPRRQPNQWRNVSFQKNLDFQMNSFLKTKFYINVHWPILKLVTQISLSDICLTVHHWYK